MKRTLFYITTLTVATLASCQKSDDAVLPSNDNNIVEISAQCTKTRTELGADGLTVNWSAGDELSLYKKSVDNQKGDKHKFSISEFEGSSAKFTGELPTAEATEGVLYYALYPYTATSFSRANTASPFVKTPVGSTQNYVANSFDKSANFSFATSVDGVNFTFKNVCGILRLNLTGSQKVTSIVLDYGTADNTFAGLLTILESDPAAAKLTTNATYLESKTLTYDCGAGVQLDETTATPFNIVLVPTKTVFKITINYEGGSYEIIPQSVDIQAGKVTPASIALQSSSIVNDNVYGFETSSDAWYITTTGAAYWSFVESPTVQGSKALKYSSTVYNISGNQNKVNVIASKTENHVTFTEAGTYTLKIKVYIAKEEDKPSLFTTVIAGIPTLKWDAELAELADYGVWTEFSKDFTVDAEDINVGKQVTIQVPAYNATSNPDTSGEFIVDAIQIIKAE